MKTLKFLSTLFVSIILFAASASASGPDSTNTKTTTKIFTPVFQTLHDCEITYYVIKINDENVLIDNKGRVIRYLCDDEKWNTSEGYELVNVPAYLVSR